MDSELVSSAMILFLGFVFRPSCEVYSSNAMQFGTTPQCTDRARHSSLCSFHILAEYQCRSEANTQKLHVVSSSALAQKMVGFCHPSNLGIVSQVVSMVLRMTLSTTGLTASDSNAGLPEDWPYT